MNNNFQQKKKKKLKGSLNFDFSDPNLYVPVYLPLLHDKNRLKIIYGSRGSAKSIFAAQKKIIRCLSMPYFKCLLVRKMRSDVARSLYDTVKAVIKMWGLKKYFRFYEGRHEIHCFNGNVFLPKGLKEVGGKSGNAKGIENPTDALIDEADEITEQEYRNLTLSLRGTEDIEEIMLFNPPDEEHWIVKRYFPPKETFEEQDGTHTYIPATLPNVTILHTTYFMNPFCKDSEKQKQQEDKVRNPKSYEQTGLGLLVSTKLSGTAFEEFDKQVHVIEQDLYDKDEYIVELWDFNKFPHHTVSLWQVRHNEQNRTMDCICLKEYCLENKSVRSVQQIINKDLRKMGYNPKKVRIIGDHSGHTARDHGELAFIPRIFDELDKDGFDPVDETKPQPSVATSIDFVNDIFLGAIEMVAFSPYPKGTTVRILIHRSCKFHIIDFEKTLVGKDGKLIKAKKTEVLNDPSGQVRRTYEARGHAVDCLRYLMCSLFPHEYAAFKSKNKRRKND